MASQMFKLKKRAYIFSLGFFCRTIPRRNQKDYVKNKERVLILINARIGEFNKIYGYNFNKINIRNQKTRWGSCSVKKNLNFNYRIIYLPTKIIDYVIIHELCHLKEFNHSRRFWDLVKRGIPDYRDIRKELKGL